MVGGCRMQRSRKKEGQPLAGMHPKVDAYVGEATRNPRREVEMSYEVRPRPRYDPTNARADTVAKPLSEPPQQGGAEHHSVTCPGSIHGSLGFHNTIVSARTFHHRSYLEPFTLLL